MNEDPAEADFIRIPRPRSVVRMLLELCCLRLERLKVSVRSETITEVTRILSESGREGQIISHESADNQWSVTLGGPPSTWPSPEAA